MAETNLNPWMEDVRGRYGNMIFRRQFGRVVIGRRTLKEPKPPTPSQVEQRTAFGDAVSYARGALANPVTRAVYARVSAAKQTSMFALAVGDWFKGPQIQKIDIEDYQGQIGGKIVISAIDNVEVAKVTVMIRNAATSAVIEQGVAVETFGKWIYTATTNRPAGQPVTIVVAAEDHAENTGSQNKEYPTP
jgi:hypothetical protein